MKKTLLILLALILTTNGNAQKKEIEISYKVKDDNSVDFSYVKNVPGSYYLIIEFDRLVNCSKSRVYKKVIKHLTGSLFTLKPYEERKGISFSYNVRYILGNPKPKIDNDIVYALPFKKGKSIKVMEAKNLGEQYFGSEKPLDWKSFIVYSNQPDTIYAMRKGIVVSIDSDYSNNNTSKKIYTSERNRILVEHSDGSYANYKGFDKKNIYVKPGEKVYPQTPLGQLETFNDDNYRLDFNTFHFLENLLDDEKSTLKNKNHKTKYLNPDFYVDNGNKKIKSDETYTVSFNEEIRLQEFSKREKKKYKKDPAIFE